jgi:hypothetical protein
MREDDNTRLNLWDGGVGGCEARRYKGKGRGEGNGKSKSKSKSKSEGKVSRT